MTRSASPVRRAAFAGRWYPGTAQTLATAIDSYLGAVAGFPGTFSHIDALVSPHAGLLYSGPVAAHGYAAVRDRPYDVAVLVGPSHYASFEGVAAAKGTFDTPLGPLIVDDELVDRLLARSSICAEHPEVHAREHSLELQLPFLKRVLPDVPILPLVMGHQRRETVEALAGALANVLEGRTPLLVASSDLSHYHDAATAARLDGVVLDHLGRQDPEGLQRSLDHRPEHACGGGPIVTVMRAARARGARHGQVLRYADSGDVSGDKAQVVGYVSAVFGSRRPADA